jgi:hypothetical protein
MVGGRAAGPVGAEVAAELDAVHGPGGRLDDVAELGQQGGGGVHRGADLRVRLGPNHGGAGQPDAEPAGPGARHGADDREGGVGRFGGGEQGGAIADAAADDVLVGDGDGGGGPPAAQGGAHAAVGGLEPEQAAAAGGDADGAAPIGGVGDGHDAGRDGRRSPAELPPDERVRSQGLRVGGAPTGSVVGR